MSQKQKTKISTNYALASLLALLLTTCLLGACATHVQVSGTFPEPLSKQYPYTTILVLDEAFRNYRFENLEPKELSLSVGETQTQLFEMVSNSLFLLTETRNTLPEQPSSDLVLVASVADVQIAMPYETQLNVFEVWIKYKLELLNNKGELITQWAMPAYGKTPSRFLKSESEALNQATIVALRDAGANLISGFEKNHEVKSWLAEQAASTTSHKP